MNTKWFLTGVLIVAAASAATFADPFIVMATDHCMACNDSATGPDNSRSETISDVRNFYAIDEAGVVTTRRRIAFYSYTLPELQVGERFVNCYLTLNVHKGDSDKHVWVYAVREAYDNIALDGKHWNTLPGLKRNPTAPVGAEIREDSLNHSEITPMLLSFVRPATLDAWESTATSIGLDEILNADEDGNVLLMFVTYDAPNCEICSPTNSAAFSTDPLLKGILLRGDIEKGTHAYAPVPFTGSYADTSLAQVSWTNPEPNLPSGTITCDVYFGDTEPNLAKAGYDLTPLATGTSATSAALPTLQKDKTYYWVVDVHDTTGGLTQGFAWTFNTLNQMPSVPNGYAGAWLPDHLSANLTLNVTDPDNYPDPLTYFWEQYSAPTGVTIDINPNVTASTSVTLPAQTGEYVFKLTASDGAAQGVGYVQVFVRNDACAAARAIPSYSAPTDFNSDCLTNLADLATIAANWLKCHPYMGQIDATCN
ncbi:MAG: hypothetical protein LLF76_04715 [Planctomycetaceae bacterium]|nr:hypothetical protein [Planctomycetaceae bacterium]